MRSSEPAPTSIVCPRCKRQSFNPNDAFYRYCGNCHLFHDEMRPTDLRCIGCGKTPEDIAEYVDLAKTERYASPSAACRDNEGTLNRATGLFACTACYIAFGCPAHSGRPWRAGDPIV